LEIYGLLKQGTLGDCNTKKPWFADFKNRFKWDAWNGNKGMSIWDARGAYVELLMKIGVTVE
jgi:diazepam-binding inhibitor (GABA receptor modulating acyl-CoA-binding protein)